MAEPGVGMVGPGPTMERGRKAGTGTRPVQATARNPNVNIINIQMLIGRTGDCGSATAPMQRLVPTLGFDQGRPSAGTDARKGNINHARCAPSTVQTVG